MWQSTKRGTHRAEDRASSSGHFERDPVAPEEPVSHPKPVSAKERRFHLQDGTRVDGTVHRYGSRLCTRCNCQVIQSTSQVSLLNLLPSPRESIFKVFRQITWRVSRTCVASNLLATYNCRRDQQTATASSYLLTCQQLSTVLRHLPGNNVLWFSVMQHGVFLGRA